MLLEFYRRLPCSPRTRKYKEASDSKSDTNPLAATCLYFDTVFGAQSRLLAGLMSSQQAGGKSLAAKIVKMAACLTHTKGSKGGYSSIK
jgi:hypothetical protein